MMANGFFEMAVLIAGQSANSADDSPSFIQRAIWVGSLVEDFLPLAGTRIPVCIELKVAHDPILMRVEAVSCGMKWPRFVSGRLAESF